MLSALLIALTAAPALAQDAALSTSLERTLVPSAGMATEDGPGALWVNPANLAYDPDPRWGIFHRYDPDGDRLHAVGGTYGIGGFGVGLRWYGDRLGRSDFIADMALGVKLPERVTVGAALRWNILYGLDNFVAFDFAAAWRPVPWIGVTVLTRNIGNPGGSRLALPTVGGGLAVRPVGDILLVGIDWTHTFDPFGDDGIVGGAPNDRLALTTRVRPLPGFFLRAGLDSRLQFGAGFELYFGGVGFGSHASSADYDGPPTITSWIGSDERDEHLAPPPRQVSALTIDERPPYEPPRRLLRRGETSWLETLEHLRRVEGERGLRGVLLSLGDVDLSWAQWQELRDAVSAVRAAGAVVVVHLVGRAGNGALYTASVADRILVHPAAEVALTGPSAETAYLRGLLDTVGVEVEVVRAGRYKDAAEALVERAPSPAGREQVEALLDDTYQTLVSGIALGRRRTEADVETWIDQGPRPAADAVDAGIVDARAYPDQAREHLEELVDGRVRLVDLGERRQPRSPWEDPDQIAIVYVNGTIVSGPSQAGGLLSAHAAGSTTIVELLEEAARDVKTRAVVLRIDSPGGSAFASDEIWRAVARVRAAGKPVVASLGGVAASGGYYVASGADAIWAEPTTVTGSIGVVALKPNIAGLADRLGIETTRISRGRFAGMGTPWRPWDPIERARIQALVDDTYDRFKERVAQGRGMSAEDVEAVAQGRVWSGTAAAAIGLVDQLGGFEAALQDAKRLAGIPDRRPVSYVGMRTRRRLGDVLISDVLGIATQVRLARIDRTLASVGEQGLLSGTPLAPIQALLEAAASHGELTWMIDPALVQVGAR